MRDAVSELMVRFPSPRVVAVIQARLTSTRLPAKIQLDLAGKTALERCVGRVQRIAGVSEVVVATSVDSSDDLVVSAAGRLGVRVVRGALDDVLGRFVSAARETEADAVVRITSDCPLLDPRESARVVARFLAGDVDYVSNTLTRRYPRGLDTEVFSREALERASSEAPAGPEREHVTLRMYSHAELFTCAGVTPEDGVDRSGHRWTLDTLEDYRMLYAIFEALGAREAAASYVEVAEIAGRMTALNASVAQKRV